MVNLLSDAATKAGAPLSDLDKKILSEESSALGPMPDDLRQRAKKLIAQVFETEPWDEMERSPKDFGSSLEWAGDSGRRNIVVLAEEVACDIARPSLPLHGWGLVKDKLQLVGCGVLLILLTAAIIAGVQALFGWK
jgi:hypothetical protein